MNSRYIAVMARNEGAAEQELIRDRGTWYALRELAMLRGFSTNWDRDLTAYDARLFANAIAASFKTIEDKYRPAASELIAVLRAGGPIMMLPRELPPRRYR